MASETIAELFDRCVESFRVLGHTNATLADEFGRLNIWGEQSKANQRGRGSLDDELRHSDEVQALAKSILLRLDAILRRGMSTAATTCILLT